MESLFNLFSTNLKSRYLTLLKNLKYKSNSFYDAYNSLMEELLKEIAMKELRLERIRGSIHDILNREEVKNYFLNTLNVTNTSYKKLLDYASKINQHKHKIEHELTLENALSYIKIMYDFLYAYTSFKGLTIPNYDEDYLRGLFGICIKDNKIDARLALMEAKLDDIYKYSGAYDNQIKEEAEIEKARIQAKIEDLKRNGKRMISYSEPLTDISIDKRKIFISAIIIGICLLSNLIYSIIYFGKSFYPWFIGLFIFIAYYSYISIVSLRLKDTDDIKKIRNLYIMDFEKLEDGNYYPFKFKTLSSLLFPLALSFYSIMLSGSIYNLRVSGVAETILSFILIIEIVIVFVFRRNTYQFLEKYENIYLYDDEAEVTYWPEFNQFLDFKFKK